MALQSSEFSRKLSYYQSANKDNASVKSNFVVRIAEYQTIINGLAVKKKEDPLQHELILGRRGSGKSTLLKRIQIELQENTDLSNKYIAINLAEEQTSIYRLFDLWLEVIREIEDCYDFSYNLKEYSSFNSDEAYTRYLFQEIHKYLNKKDKKLVLLLDNFDRIIENFNDDGNLLREFLINYNHIQIIGGSTRMNEHFWTYDLPFYEFFRVHRLQSLSTKEMIKLILHWSETLQIEHLKTFARQNTGKIEAIRILTDGLPRTLQFFIEILLDNSYLYGYEYLKDIMDKVTPVYQERLNTLTPPLRKIVAEMAFLWEASSTKQLVDKCKMPSKIISAHLKTLMNKGIVTKIETGTKNHLYRISERFFNMWFIVTQGSPAEKRKAKWLSIFLENWYDVHEFKNLIQKHINALWGKKIPYDKALPLSKGLIHSKHISTAQRDTIITLVEGLQETKQDSLIQLPKKYKDIFEEVKSLSEHQKYDEAIQLVNTIENEADGIKFYLLGYLNNESQRLKESEKYYLMAVEKGDENAMINLAVLYQNIEKFDLAEKYYLMAVEKGDEKAMFNLALLYESSEKFDLAEKYYLMAVEKGDEKAMLNLALLYVDTGRLELAEKYYLIAVEKGDENALNNLALLYQKSEKFDLAEKYYLMAVEKGDEKAMFNLALFYENSEKFDLAEKYYLMAVEKGDENAMINLALMYYGDNKNKKDALSLIKRHNKVNISKENKFTQFIIEIWNGIFNDVENQFKTVLNEAITDDIFIVFREFLVHQQYQMVYNLFTKYGFSQELQDRFQVIYYVVLLKIKDSNDKIKLTIPPELKETIQSVQDYIQERQEFYGYV